MGKSSSEFRQINNDSFSSLIVPTLGGKTNSEFGLLEFDQNGITYKPVARFSWWLWLLSLLALVLFVGLWIILLINVNFSRVRVNIVPVLGSLFIVWRLISYLTAPRRKVLKETKTARSTGLSTVHTLDEGWHVGWKDVVAVSVPSHGPVTFHLTATSGKTFAYRILGYDKLTNFSANPELVAAVRDAVTSHAPEKHES